MVCVYRCQRKPDILEKHLPILIGSQTTPTTDPQPLPPSSRESFQRIAQKRFAKKTNLTLPERNPTYHELCRSFSLGVRQPVARYSPQTMRRNNTLPNPPPTKQPPKQTLSSCLTSTDYDEIYSKSQFDLTGHDAPKGLSIQERAEASWKQNFFFFQPPSKRLINSVYVERWLATSGTDEPMFPSMRRYMTHHL